MPTLPPAVRDPSSGETFIAIPAPPFVFTPSTASTPGRGLDGTSHEHAGYLYIERPSLADFSMRRVFASASKCAKPEKQIPSVEVWMAGLFCAESPPGHRPWEGYVEELSLSASNNSLGKRRPSIPRLRFTRCSTLIASKSDSSFEIPLGECGSALLDSSLPSTSSSAWSGGLSLPHIYKFLESESPPEPAPAPAPVPIPALPVIKPLQPHKRFKCAPDTPTRREAHVLDRRLTLEKIEKVLTTPSDFDGSPTKPPSPMDDMLSQIEAFLADGMAKMDNDMQQLGLEKGKLQSPATPSLVVSNSTQVLPLTADVMHSTPPLAIRRGRKVPGSLQLKPSLTAFAYPDMPTAFRGSPGPGSPCFATEPVYPELKLDMTMSTEDMISSLRAQVESFKPVMRPVGPLKDKCDNAIKWFESEMALESAGSPLDTLVESLSKSNCSSPSPSPLITVPREDSRPLPSPTDSIRLTKMRASMALSGRGSPALEGKDIKLPSENLRDWNAVRTKPRAATVSGGTPTLDDRKVRFSALPPDVIPEDILEKKATQSQSDAANDVAGENRKSATMTSPNKPVYRQFTQVRRTPTPTKSGMPVVSGRARAMSTSSTLVGTPQRKKLPPSPLGQVSPVTRRPLSFMIRKGKENKPPKVSGISFLKRKSLAAIDEETKPEKISPLQSVLNRLRG